MDSDTQVGKLRIPFNTYDIFGYLIPGTSFVFSIFLFEFWIHSNLGNSSNLFHFPFYTLIKISSTNKIFEGWIFGLLYLFVFIIVTYVIGHVIATISSLFIDRMLIYKGYGYPYEILLQIGGSNIFRNSYLSFSKAFYRGIFFWIDFCLLLWYINIFFLKSNSTVQIIIYLLAGVLVVIMAIFKIIISAIKHKRKGKLFKYFYSGKGKKIRESIRRIFLCAFPSIYDLVANILSEYINSRKSFNKEFIDRYKKYFIKNFKFDPEKAETNNYWLSYCYIADKSLVFSKLISNWLHLYAFARNLSASFYLAFLYCILFIYYQSDILAISNDFIIKIVPVIFLFLSVLMLVRYYYLYVSYLSKFVFRSFVYLNEMEDKK